MSIASLCERCGTPRASASTCCPTCCARKRGAPVSSVAALGLVVLVGCGDKEELFEPAYGMPADTAWFEDNDGDGFSEDEGDCNDEDQTIHPEAEETPGDGVDSNCDGNDDT